MGPAMFSSARRKPWFEGPIDGIRRPVTRANDGIDSVGDGIASSPAPGPAVGLVPRQHDSASGVEAALTNRLRGACTDAGLHGGDHARRQWRCTADVATAGAWPSHAGISMPRTLPPRAERPVNAKSTSGANPLTMRAMLLPEPQEWVQPSVPWPVLR